MVPIKENLIYLDYNATTPIDKEVLQEMIFAYENHFANSSSTTHLPGWESRGLLNKYRKKVANLIGAESKSIFFTSGATESNNTILNLIVEKFFTHHHPIHIIVSAIEHKSILAYCEKLERANQAQVTYIPVNSSGEIDILFLEKSILPNTVLISIMAANNETGVLQPIKKISEIAKRRNILFHSDAAQIIGKYPFNVKEISFDFISFTAHKFYGPKGVGALYALNPTLLQKFPLIIGGGQENGARAGTLNLPSIAGMAKACELVEKNLGDEVSRFIKMKEEFINSLQSKLPQKLKINGEKARTLPNTLNFHVPGVDGKKLLSLINNNLALSSGSACTSSNQSPSHVLKAMGAKNEEIQSSFRLSFGRFTSEKELNDSVYYLSNTIKELTKSC